MGASHPVKSMIGRCFVALLELTYAAIVKGQTCYTPYGSAFTQYGICEPSQNDSLCCAIGDSCLSNKLCRATDTNFYRGGCTDISYRSDQCPSFCNNSYSLYYPPGVVRAGGAAYLVTECGDFTSKYYCCDEDGSRRCCDDPAKNLGLTVADDSFIASTPTQYVGSTPTAVSQTGQPSGTQGPQSSPTTTVDTGNTASNHSDHHSVVVGAATGSSIAGVIIIVSGIVTCIWLKRHPPKQENQEDQEQGVERAAVDEPNRPARVLDWADTTLLDTDRDLLSPIHTQDPSHNAFEVSSPTIRRLTSFTHSPPSPLSTSNAESHRRMPSADQVSAISIGSPYIPYHPPPRTVAPSAAAELESGFDISPIQVPSHSASQPPPPAPLELEARDGVTITALWHANSSPDSPRGPTRLGSPLSTMLQGSTTSFEPAHPLAEAPTESAGSAESTMNKAATLGTPLSTAVQSPHSTTERKTRLVPTLEALREGEPSEADGCSQDLQRAHDEGQTSEEANMPSTSAVSPEPEARNR